MLTRAIVTEVLETKLRLRIPILDGKEGEKESTSNADLGLASILCIPGMDVQYKEGDIVIVGFEDNSIDYPIVLGHLKTSTPTVNEGTRVSCSMQKLTVDESFISPIDTTIGNISYSDLWENTAGK